MGKKSKLLSKDFTTILVVIILLLVIILLGAGYGWLRLAVSGSKVNVIRAAKVEMYLDESLSEDIKLENSVPMSDADGLATTPYVFRLKNDSNYSFDYEIYLDDLPLDINDKRMKDDFVRYSISRDNASTTTALLSSIGTNPSRLIASGNIGKEEITYKLNVWLDKDATNEVMGTIFYASLRLKVNQTT